MSGCGDQENCGCSNPIEQIAAGATGPTGPAGSSGSSVIYSSIGTTSTNTTTSSESLDSYSLPADTIDDTLASDGDYIEFIDYFKINSNDTIDFEIRFGSVVLLRQGTVCKTGCYIKTVFRIHRISQTSQYYEGNFYLYPTVSDLEVLNWRQSTTPMASNLSIVNAIDALVNTGAIGSVSHLGKTVTLFKI